jgi:predicted ATPase
MVGRDDELAALVALLDAADGGRPGFAALVGEPGIGKSRLASELARVAQDRGATVLVGRCSQDEGAPPLWPWRSVMAGLGEELAGDQVADDDGGARFRSWERIARQLLEASTEQTLLVVLDDLHWADASSLRVLGLLLEIAEQGRCLVVCTWRDQPPPTGALAAAAEGMARRHCLRLHLSGPAVARRRAGGGGGGAGAAPRTPTPEALRARTDGNPFFWSSTPAWAARVDGERCSRI